MFHQVLIRPEDYQAQRFRWRDHPSLPLQVFVMDVAIFGASCTSCSLQFGKNLKADKQAGDMQCNHYVNVYLDIVDTVHEAVELMNEGRTTHANGGLDIRQWMLNSTDVLSE